MKKGFALFVISALAGGLSFGPNEILAQDDAPGAAIENDANDVEPAEDSTPSAEPEDGGETLENNVPSSESDDGNESSEGGALSPDSEDNDESSEDSEVLDMSGDEDSDKTPGDAESSGEGEAEQGGGEAAEEN